MHNRTGGDPPTKGEASNIFAIAVAIFCFGGMIGGSLVGTVADKFGRKGGLLLNNVLVVITVLFEGFAKSCSSYEMLIAGRFFIGINAGLNAGLAPMYLAEISPIHLRGAVGTVYQLIITISILVAQILGLESILGTATQWPLLLCLTIVPAIFQVCTLPLCPESPKYLLLSKGKDMAAQRGIHIKCIILFLNLSIVFNCKFHWIWCGEWGKKNVTIFHSCIQYNCNESKTFGILLRCTSSESIHKFE